MSKWFGSLNRLTLEPRFCWRCLHLWLSAPRRFAQGGVWNFVWLKKMQHNMRAIWRWILRTLARSPYGNLQPSNGWSSCPVCKAQCPGCSAQFGYHWIVSICEDLRPNLGRAVDVYMSVLVRLLCLNRLWRRCMPGMEVVLIQNNGMQICHLGHQAGRETKIRVSRLCESCHTLIFYVR